MQNSPAAHVGDTVRVRRERWSVVDTRSYDRCEIVTLAGLGPANKGVTLRVIRPFDLLEPIALRAHPKPIRPVLWRRACRALVAAQSPPGGLDTARQATIDLLPYQLEPALALVRGLGSRVLLADDVGLGKTIQAGLIISELRARGAADRVLVLTPLGLRDQWSRELERFGIESRVVDVAALRRRMATLPVGVNPWTTMPVAIASIDYIKRPEVLSDLLLCAWEAVVVDEAHGAVGGTDRHAAVAAITSRASFVVLVTATPHNGDREAFSSLCRMGSAGGDSLVVFRRTRRDVGLDLVRHIHTLSVRPNADEARMHALLVRFTRVMRDERGEGVVLALAVLHKRAFSSANSLARSVARRLGTLSSTPQDGLEQMPLPIGDPSGELCPDDDPPVWPSALALGDVRRERRLLRALAQAAAAAARRETKIEALKRLLRRVGEPAIVFTEYRDTLLHLQQQLDRPVAVLHGGMTRDERIVSLDRFTRGTGVVLLATDVAGQGLNLHHACRLVINLELPWNPMRLEQRIGRVDRIGQRREVHAFHLIARETGESAVLERLKTRIARGRTDIRMSDPLGDVEQVVARLVVGAPAPPRGHSEEVAGHCLEGAERVPAELAGTAAAEARRLAWSRLILRKGDPEALARLESRGPGMTGMRRWQTRSQLASTLILIWCVAYEDHWGRRVASTMAALAVRVPRGRLDVAAVLRRFDAELRQKIDVATGRWRQETASLHRSFVATRLSRARAIAGTTRSSAEGLFQAGLFDRRVELARAVMAAAEHDADIDQRARLENLERGLALIAVPAQLLLVLTP